MKSLFCKASYWVNISVRISSNIWLTLTILSDTEPGPSLVEKKFLPPTWWKLTKSIKSLPLCTGNRRVAFTDGIVPHFVHTEDLCLQVWFGLLHNFIVGVLFWSVVYRSLYPWDISSGAKICPFALETSGQFSDRKKNNTIITDTWIIDLNTLAIISTTMDEHYRHRLAHQTTIPADL